MERAAGKGASEVGDAQLQLLLVRVAALTDALRNAAPNDAARAATRLLIADLSSVAGQFRGRANTIRASLAEAEKGLRDALGRFETSRARPTAPAVLPSQAANE